MTLPTPSPDSFRGPHKLRGLVPVLPTPLLVDESIDHASIEKLAEYTLAYPFSAVWALASAGEDENLPWSTIVECTESLGRHFGGKLPLLVKSSAPGTKQTIEQTRQLAGLGIDAAVIHFQHKQMSDEHARRYFLEVAEASPVPLFIYHNAGRGAQHSQSLLVELSHHPRIAGMKAGGYHLSEIQRLCLFCDPDFSVFPAGGGQILASLAMGASGHMALPLLAFPERAFALAQHVEAGCLEEARIEMRIILQFLAGMPKTQNREVCAEVKGVLEIRGVLQRHVSSPFRALTDTQQQELASLIETLDLFSTGPVD